MRSFSGGAFALAALVAVGMAISAAGCARVSEIKARKAFKEANQAYQQQDYKRAVELYQETVQADPNIRTAYFFLGNSYDNLYKPSKRGDPQNDELLNSAVKNYETAAEKLMASNSPEEKRYGVLALQFLVAAYGADKLNDPAKAEPVVQRMIQLEPAETSNYFVLAKLYEDAGVYDEAEKVYLLAKSAKPNDPAVYTMLAAYYNRQGQFDKTIEALEQRAAKEPNNPEAFHTIASYYWDKATRDARLRDNEKKDFVLKGIAAADRALQIKADYSDALVFKNLLLRLEANLEKDVNKQQALLKEANQLRDRAEELRKKKAAGIGN